MRLWKELYGEERSGELWFLWLLCRIHVISYSVLVMSGL